MNILLVQFIYLNDKKYTKDLPPVEQRHIGLNLHGLYRCSFSAADKDASLIAWQPPNENHSGSRRKSHEVNKSTIIFLRNILD